MKVIRSLTDKMKKNEAIDIQHRHSNDETLVPVEHVEGAFISVNWYSTSIRKLVSAKNHGYEVQYP